MKLPAFRWLPNRWRLALTITACLAAYSAHADEPQHDLLLFASVDAYDNFGVSNPDAEDTFVRPVLDGLYSFSGDRYRFLAEYLWTDEESELERMKFGWDFGSDTTVWLGRMHAISKYWTSEYHHGQFMQTPITRPSVEEWEDQSGPLPSHVAGISLDHRWNRDDRSVVSLGATIGLAPRFVDESLQPYDLLNPDPGHGGSVGLRFAYSPDLFSGNQVGFVLSSNDINADSESNPALTDLVDIKQLAYGFFWDWSWDAWRLLGSVIRFDSDLHYLADEVHDDFASGYVQLEYQVSNDWTVYARSDNSEGEDFSPYLRLLPAFVAHRQMAGVRWDFVDFQALTLELAEVSQQGDDSDHDNFKEIRMQWSALFP